jgi:hypothetical protein
VHDRARDISFGRQGRFGDRSYEAQLSQASALSLVINASEPSVDLDKAFIEPEMSIIARPIGGAKIPRLGKRLQRRLPDYVTLLTRSGVLGLLSHPQESRFRPTACPVLASRLRPGRGPARSAPPLECPPARPGWR